VLFCSLNLFLFSLGRFPSEATVLGESGARTRAATLTAKPKQRQAAVEALTSVDDDHPSRVLIERLIADETTWAALHDEWSQLARSKESWITLTELLNRNGDERVSSKLERIGLTSGAASAVTLLLSSFGMIHCYSLIFVARC
jgi:hypothetical protein